jgi:hypothetical protein
MTFAADAPMDSRPCLAFADALGPLARATGWRILRDMVPRPAANDRRIFDRDVMILCSPVSDQHTRIPRSGRDGVRGALAIHHRV